MAIHHVYQYRSARHAQVVCLVLNDWQRARGAVRQFARPLTVRPGGIFPNSITRVVPALAGSLIG